MRSALSQGLGLSNERVRVPSQSHASRSYVLNSSIARANTQTCMLRYCQA
jgi:hypothetical protein